jgi:hypothetical protein
MKINVARDQGRERRIFVGFAACLQRAFEFRPARPIGANTKCRKARCESIDGTAHFVELTNPHRIELGDLEAFAAAFGDQSLLVQQMQRVADRLAGDAKSLGKFILPDPMPGRQGTVDNAVEDSTVDLMD